MKRNSSAIDLAPLTRIAEALSRAHTEKERIEILRNAIAAKQLFPEMVKDFSTFDEASCVILYALIVLEQSEILQRTEPRYWQALIDALKPADLFYRSMGGIVGYQVMLLRLLRQKNQNTAPSDIHFESPPRIDIRNLNTSVWHAILAGLLALPGIAELYPIGGAADRLHLTEGRLQIALPAARLKCLGRTLLEHLIIDVQAREYLYYKLFHTQLTTPIAMMTSSEKDNHRHIVTMCKEKGWFGRPKESFHFFCQPLVPVVNQEEKWCQLPDGTLLMKPGGHGMIWKAALESSLLDRFQESGCTSLLVRQINNPIAGCDYGILAFCGIGCMQNHFFGFASSPREIGTAEGMNVFITQNDHVCLSSIEYCDFHARGIEDSEANALRFPSNTNILFANIKAIRNAAHKHPFPGMVAQWKKVRIGQREETIARLETTMQSIADHFSAKTFSQLRTYLTFYERRKTISTTKHAFSPNTSFFETPEHCLYDHLCNCRELLVEYADFSVPPMPSKEVFIREAPPFLFLYHPALGPLFSLIGKKLRRGKIAKKSELSLQISELYLEDLSLDGSLQINAECIMGTTETNGLLRYSEDVGHCCLRNVRVQNRGIHWQKTHNFWQPDIYRNELCSIHIAGNGELIAEDITIHGAFSVHVRSGERVRIQEASDGSLQCLREKIDTPSWKWDYVIEDGKIEAKRVDMATRIYTNRGK